MKISAFTQTEIDYLEIVCNFTDYELQLFKLRAQDIPLEECAERMNMSVSTVKRISKDVIAKIMREC